MLFTRVSGIAVAGALLVAVASPAAAQTTYPSMKLQGRLQSRSWEQEGQKRSKVEVLANDVTFLDSRGAGGDSEGSSYGGASEPAPASDAPAAKDEKPKPSKKAKKDDVVIEDIGDEPINLDDIPF